MEKYIIEKLRLGDEQAFRYIYDCHYILLCRFAYQLLDDVALAEEIVDDTIFYLWEHRTDIEITFSLRAYLMRAVRNRCLNELNSQRHRKELHFSSFMLPENMEFLDSVFVEDNHPLGTLLEQELEEKKYEEIADELKISVNTVKYHIKNALASIQLHMGDYLKLLILYMFWEN